MIEVEIGYYTFDPCKGIAVDGYKVSWVFRQSRFLVCLKYARSHDLSRIFFCFLTSYFESRITKRTQDGRVIA